MLQLTCMTDSEYVIYGFWIDATAKSGYLRNASTSFNF
jgi:hypothetical protein